MVDGRADDDGDLGMRRVVTIVLTLEVPERPKDLRATFEVTEVHVGMIGVTDGPQHLALDRLERPLTEAALGGVEAVDRPHQPEQSGCLEVRRIVAARVRGEPLAVRTNESEVELHDLGGHVLDLPAKPGHRPSVGDLFVQFGQLPLQFSPPLEQCRVPVDEVVRGHCH